MLGNGVSAGVGIAQVLIWQPAIAQDYVPRKSSKSKGELERFDRALHRLLGRHKGFRAKTARHMGNEEAAIFEAYSMMLSDEEAVLRPIKESIRLHSLSAEYAVNLQFGKLARCFLEMENEYMRQRAEDVFNLRDALLREMLGIPVAEVSHLDHPTVVVANALSPLDLVSLDISRLQGFVCETGGYSSHTAILARSQGIPAVLEAKCILEHVKDGDIIALDGSSGEIWINPNQSEIEMLHIRADKFVEKREEMKSFRGRPTITRDGRRIELTVNLAQLEELEIARAADAEAVGLFRTELLYMAHPPLPLEEEQVQAYRTILEQMGGKSVVVRTFDDGASSRSLQALRPREEENPALGYRGIRMSLGRPSFFRTQLRALLRASAYGSIKVLFPMVSSMEEIRDAKAALSTVKKELQREEIPYDENMQVGLLMAVPSAVILSEAFAAEVDFFSIGINDMIQFTLAVDRGNQDLNHLCHILHPAVLRQIKWVVDAAHHHNIPCNICGEPKGYETVLPLLVGLGLDGFSVNPTQLLNNRKIINQCSFSSCKQMASDALQLHSAFDVEKMLTC